jgi:membrane associated rhomboid family serine protease
VYGRGQQTPGFGFGPPVTPPIIKNLLIANAAVFVLQKLFGGQVVQVGPMVAPSLDAYFAAWPFLVWQQGYLWQPFTYMWLHADIWHVAMNMFMLWMFGSQLALYWGTKRFLRYYLICGVGAGFLIVTFPYLAVAFGRDEIGLFIRTLGASGAVYGVLLAYSLTWPDRTIMLIFPPVAFRAIWLIPGLFVMTALTASPGVSHIGHLGGVLVGWILLRRGGQTGGVLSVGQLRNRWRRYRMKQRLRAVRYEEHQQRARRRDGDDKTLH